MKTMTCKQLGGACDEEFSAATWEEMQELSKQHGIKMFRLNDEAHLEAMQRMRRLMENPDAMREWMEKKQKEFEN